MIAPPLTATRAEIDKLLALLDRALAQTTIQLGPLSYAGL
jgi:4-aminobutyrate aminotransferase-like enzyme